MPLPSFKDPNSNLTPVFLLRLARIKDRTTTSTCTFLTGHFDRQVPRVAGRLLRMLRKWPMADRYIESCVSGTHAFGMTTLSQLDNQLNAKVT